MQMLEHQLASGTIIPYVRDLIGFQLNTLRNEQTRITALINTHDIVRPLSSSEAESMIQSAVATCNAKCDENMAALNARHLEELFAVRAELAALKSFCVSEVGQVKSALLGIGSSLASSVRVAFAPQPPLYDRANEDVFEVETLPVAPAKWKSVLKKYHPNAYIEPFLDEAGSNRPVLKILREFADEFIKAREIVSDNRFREIPPHLEEDFIAHFEAKCRTFAGQNVSEEIKHHINSAFTVVGKKFSVKVSGSKPVRCYSGGGCGGSRESVSKKRTHDDHELDVDYTPSKQRLDSVADPEPEVVRGSDNDGAEDQEDEEDPVGDK
ncbi:hypothetical protein BJ741DRAFT_639517 [Chytriomyces cf. hyalinus JEL632]|nr:hypothetical protein BJ741DRAFT_639517 [Chytriomyces cf. hyalinus JEL632]